MKDSRIRIIFFLVLIDMLSFSIVLPLLPYLGRSLGATTLQLGFLGMCYPVAQTIASPLLGRLSDRIGRKPVLGLSVSGTVLGFTILALSQQPAFIEFGRGLSESWGINVNAMYFVLLMGRILDGITGGNIAVAQAYISDVTSKENRAQALGLISAAFGIGFIVGPITGGMLFGISPSAPALLGASLAFINVLLILAILPESLTDETRKQNRLNPRRKIWSRETVAWISFHPALAPLMSARVLTGLGFALFEGGFSLWALTTLKLPALQNSLFLAYLGALGVLTQVLLIKPLTRRFTDAQLLIGMNLLAMTAFFLWGLVGSPWQLWLIMPLMSISISTTNTVLTSGLSKSVTPGEVGTILGVQTSVMSVSRAIAPLTAASLISMGTLTIPSGVVLLGGLASIPGPGWAAAGLCLGSAAAVWVLIHRIKCGICGPI